MNDRFLTKEDFRKIWDETLCQIPDLEFECSPQLKEHLLNIADGKYTGDEIAKCMGFSDPDFVSYVGTVKEDLDVTRERLEEIFSCQPDKDQLTAKEYKAVMENIDLAMKDAQEDLDQLRHVLYDGTLEELDIEVDNSGMENIDSPFHKAAEILARNKVECAGNPNVETGDSPRKKALMKEITAGKFNIDLEELKADLTAQGKEDREWMPSYFNSTDRLNISIGTFNMGLTVKARETWTADAVVEVLKEAIRLIETPVEIDHELF